MDIIKTVSVKQILTEKQKQIYLDDFNKDLHEMHVELEQLKFQLHKQLKTSQYNRETKHALKHKYMQEIKQREERLESLRFKVQQLEKLPVGAELQEGTVQVLCSVKVGDSWDDVTKGGEIIIKDGIIHEIREGRFKQ